MFPRSISASILFFVTLLTCNSAFGYLKHIITLKVWQQYFGSSKVTYFFWNISESQEVWEFVSWIWREIWTDKRKDIHSHPITLLLDDKYIFMGSHHLVGKVSSLLGCYTMLTIKHCHIMRIQSFHLQDREKVWSFKTLVTCLPLNMTYSYVMALAVSHHPQTMEVQVQYKTNPWGICGGQSGIRTDFSPSTLVSPSIMQPMLHTHSFIYHWHYIILTIDSITE